MEQRIVVWWALTDDARELVRRTSMYNAAKKKKKNH